MIMNILALQAKAEAKGDFFSRLNINNFMRSLVQPVDKWLGIIDDCGEWECSDGIATTTITIIFIITTTTTMLLVLPLISLLVVLLLLLVVLLLTTTTTTSTTTTTTTITTSSITTAVALLLLLLLLLLFILFTPANITTNTGYIQPTVNDIS